MTTPETAAAFGYYVNLDERGEFYADVRNEEGATVFEIHINDDDDSIITDGFMAHKNDIEGLEAYLISLGTIKPQDSLMTGPDFETLLEDRRENSYSPDFG